jgi:HEAT repeat protein
MTSSQNLSQEQLMKWLELFGGPRSKGQEARDHALDEMRVIGADKLFPPLTSLINDPNVEIDTRCQATRAVLGLDAKHGIELLLPLFNDPDTTFRWDICGLMHEFGDDRVIEPLIDRMKNDPDPQIRGTAAYALGGIGNPAAIPALLNTFNNDHEFDQLGYSASFCAEQAIDEIHRKSKQAW